MILDAGDWSIFGQAEQLIAAVAEALAGHGPATTALPATAAIALSDDLHVRQLNLRFRGKDQPTNVLSFPAAAPFSGQSPVNGSAASMSYAQSGEQERDLSPFLGDIILARETIMREALEQDKPPAEHLQHLVLHGLLHLLGYDHETETGAGEMETLEIEVLHGLGISDPYMAAADRATNNKSQEAE